MTAQETTITKKEFANKKLLSKRLKQIHRKAKKELNGTDQPQNELLGEIGKLVKEIRLGKSLTLRQLSKLSGVSHADISRLENGRQNLSFNTLNAVVEALNYRIEINLIRNKEAMKKNKNKIVIESEQDNS